MEIREWESVLGILDFLIEETIWQSITILSIDNVSGNLKVVISFKDLEIQESILNAALAVHKMSAHFTHDVKSWAICSEQALYRQRLWGLERLRQVTILLA